MESLELAGYGCWMPEWPGSREEEPPAWSRYSQAISSVWKSCLQPVAAKHVHDSEGEPQSVKQA